MHVYLDHPVHLDNWKGLMKGYGIISEVTEINKVYHIHYPAFFDISKNRRIEKIPIQLFPGWEESFEIFFDWTWGNLSLFKVLSDIRN